MPTSFKKLGAAFIEKTVNISSSSVSLIFLSDPFLFLFFGELLDLDIRRIPNHHIESIRNAIHPLDIKELGRCVLIVRVPCGKLVRGFTAHAARCKYVGYFFANLSVALLQGELVAPALGGKVFVTYNR